MQNSLSKFHNLSFQSSRFGFYYFSPLNFIFSQLSSLFTTRYLLPLFFLVTLLSLFTYSSFSKKNLFTCSFCINLVLCLSLNRVQFLYSNLNLVLCLLPLSTLDLSSPSFPLSISRSLFLFLSPLFLPLNLSVLGGD